ncbi:autotransporter assembly complex protein TamA [Rhizorhapis sp. SPR117]|uniref:autotransporter assembly complex protein TamA n=1 Tax=Rhizorhapis sp. SPR117 TaxID=2912611 RepID=UPI001F00F4D2|nr:BamA/TamA family outer membrane protein [Rhizorhapis sp. SPR117]
MICRAYHLIRKIVVVATFLPFLSHAQTSQTPSSTSTSQQQQDRREPIITDEEFDETVPPIKDDLGAPMGSVQQWDEEQRKLEQKARAEDGKDGVATLPAAADGKAEELLADPPVNDPEIDDPLTPLSQFDVTPIDEDAYTEQADAEKPASLRYSYRITGLEELSDDSKVADVDASDITGRFKDLSALEDGDGKAANGAMVSARMREDQQLLIDILQGQGYFDAMVNGTVELPDKEEGKVNVVLSAAPGKRYAFGAIAFDSEPLVPADLARKNFKIDSGEPIVAERVQAAEANVAVELPENGYPFAQTGDRDILLDAQTGTGDYTLPISAGPRSSFGEIATSGTTAFDADHIAVLARFKKGELYDSKKVDDLRQALVATGLFSLVSITPEQTGQPGPDGTEYARLSVNQEAGPPRTIAGEAGYGTGQGFRVEGSWTHRNLFPPEGALIFGAVAGTQEQGVSARFRRSNAGKRDRTVELGVSATHSDYDAYEAYTGLISGKIAYNSTPIWQKKLTYSYGFELLASNEQDYDFTAGKLNRRTFYVAALPGQVTFDQSDDLLDPTSGYRLTAKLSPEASLGSGTQLYARGLIEGSAYYPAGNSIVLAGRVRVGSIYGADRAQIAPTRRYYAGGGGSVRGFGYQELGPKDPQNRPIGGRSLFEAAAEVRYRFGNYGIVGFVDAGQVYTSSTPGFDHIRLGAGIGGRFYTNFGPMRLDVATPINRKPGESRISIYVSIGQAF